MTELASTRPPSSNWRDWSGRPMPSSRASAGIFLRDGPGLARSLPGRKRGRHHRISRGSGYRQDSRSNRKRVNGGGAARGRAARARTASRSGSGPGPAPRRPGHRPGGDEDGPEHPRHHRAEPERRMDGRTGARPHVSTGSNAHTIVRNRQRLRGGLGGTVAPQPHQPSKAGSASQGSREPPSGQRGNRTSSASGPGSL